MAFDIWSVAQSIPLNSVQLKRLASMGLVVNFKTMQQPTILVTFFQIREYSQRTIGVELASWLASLIFLL